jgi:hypothetical protein
LPPGALTTISGEIARDDQRSFLERADEILDTIEARPSLALLPDRKGSPADVPGVANSGARWRGTINSLPLTGPIQTDIANNRCGALTAVPAVEAERPSGFPLTIAGLSGE